MHVLLQLSSLAPTPLSRGGFQSVGSDNIMIFAITFGAFESQTDQLPSRKEKKALMNKNSEE